MKGAVCVLGVMVTQRARCPYMDATAPSFHSLRQIIRLCCVGQERGRAPDGPHWPLTVSVEQSSEQERPLKDIIAHLSVRETGLPDLMGCRSAWSPPHPVSPRSLEQLPRHLQVSGLPRAAEPRGSAHLHSSECRGSAGLRCVFSGRFQSKVKTNVALRGPGTCLYI